MGVQFYRIIDKVVLSKSTKDLSKQLKKCLLLLESNSTDKRKFIKALNESLARAGGAGLLNSLLSNNNDVPRNVYVHGNKEAPIVYAAHKLVLINKIRDYKVKLRELIDFFDNECLEPKTPCLSKEQVSKVLNFLQSKYKIFDIITCKAKLEIFLFNNSHNQFNSFYEVFHDKMEPTTYVKGYIVCFAPLSNKHNPYQVLIHEIGHALQVALSHQVMVVPDSFIEMNKELKVHLSNGTVAATDVFADVFSVVTMNRSFLAEHNDLIPRFPSKVLDLFERYFDKLFQFALDNKEELKNRKMDISWLNEG